MKSAAELFEAVRFAVFFGFIMLLAVFLETMAAGDGPSEFVEVGGVLDVGFFKAGELFDELFMGLVAVLIFGVILCGARCATFSHRGPPCGAHLGKAEASGFAAARSLRSERRERSADKCSERSADYRQAHLVKTLVTIALGLAVLAPRAARAQHDMSKMEMSGP